MRNLLNIGSALRGYTVTALTTLFGLQLLRLLFPSLVGFLRDSRGFEALSLAPVALGIFALSFIAGLLLRAFGLRSSLWLTAGGLALVRLVEQISTIPLVDLILSSAGVALFLLYLPIATGVRRAQGVEGGMRLGAAVILGIALDTAIHTGLRTLDLTWQPGILPILFVGLLCIILLAALRVDLAKLDSMQIKDGPWRSTIPLIVFGPWLVLQMLVFQNVARVSTLTGLVTPLAGGLVLAGNAAALAFLPSLGKQTVRPIPASIFSAALLIVSLVDADPSGVPAILTLLIGQISSAVLILIVFSASTQESGEAGLKRTTVCYGIGQVLLVLITFLYYIAYDIPLGYKAGTILLLLGSLVVLGGLVAGFSRHDALNGIPGYIPALVAALLMIVPLLLFAAWKRPEPIQPDPSNRSLRAMTYNLHNGVNTDGRLDIEAQARVIEESGADVIALQEISRGWLIWGGLDMLAWLSQRLELPYISGPTADAQWGNAILSRYPVTESQLILLSPDDLVLQRGYIRAGIDIGAGRVAMLATHFHHAPDDDEIRAQQASEILSGIPGGTPAILVGDLNATPDSGAMHILAGGGLIDLAAAIGEPPTYTYYAASPDRQIDYIWITPDLSTSDFVIFQTTASDHLPLVATVYLP